MQQLATRIDTAAAGTITGRRRSEGKAKRMEGVAGGEPVKIMGEYDLIEGIQFYFW